MKNEIKNTCFAQKHRAVYLPKNQKKVKKFYYISSMLKLRSVRAIPNVITYLSFVFPTNLITLHYYTVTQ
jgi:hypothetical protein